MPVFLLIRHAENDYVRENRLPGRLPDIHLNEAGRQQAQNLADHLAGFPIKSIYCSPLERAIESAQPLANTLNLEIIQRQGLIELDIGDWQGEKLKTLSKLKLWRTVQGAPSRVHFPGGEWFAEAQHRICLELDELSSLHDSKDIIACFSHSDPIKLAVAFHLGLPIDLFQRITVAPASITTLLITESGSRLINLNFEISFTLPKG